MSDLVIVHMLVNGILASFQVSPEKRDELAAAGKLYEPATPQEPDETDTTEPDAADDAADSPDEVPGQANPQEPVEEPVVGPAEPEVTQEKPSPKRARGKKVAQGETGTETD